MPELWDLYNTKRESTQMLHERGKVIPAGFYHLCASAWIINSKGQYLISQRHPGKEYPCFWECTGGSAIAGESSLQCAIREVKEELGILLDSGTGKLIYQTRRDAQQDFYDVWLFRFDIPIDNLVFQRNEVIAAKWLNKNEIVSLQQELKLHPLINYLKYLD